MKCDFCNREAKWFAFDAMAFIQSVSKRINNKNRLGNLLCDVHAGEYQFYKTNKMWEELKHEHYASSR